MHNYKLYRYLVLVMLVMSGAFFAGFSQPAMAHMLYNEGFVYITSDANCTFNRTEMGADTDTTPMRTYALSRSHWALRTMWGTEQCGDFSQRPAGYISIKIELYKQTSSGWALCSNTNWAYNSSPSYSYSGSSNQGPCGSGTYQTRGAAFVNINGQWLGGWLASPNHNY
jgi:hypothetical protein